MNAPFAELVKDTAPPTLRELAERVVLAATMARNAPDKFWSAANDGSYEAEQAFKEAFFRVTGLDQVLWDAVQREMAI